MTQTTSGAVTFLFTDIEGSTALLKQLRERYGEALAAHREALEAAIVAHGGRVVDTQGDSFFVAFRRARDAVAAAVAAQQALAARPVADGAPLRVRMGIDTGEAEVEDGRYLGLAVHRAARICSAAHGGQVLLSRTTHNLLEDEEADLPGIELRDLGEQRLKDLERPVRLYQASAPGLESEFPALRTDEELSAAAEAALAPRWWRRRNVLVLAGIAAALVVGGVVAAAVLLTGGGGHSRGGLARVPLKSVGVIDPETNEIRAAIRVGNVPTSVAVGGSSVWVTNSGDETVTRIDASSHGVLATAPAPSDRGAVAADSRAAWVTSRTSSGARVSHVDPRINRVLDTFTATSPWLGGTDRSVGTSVAIGGGAVWVGIADRVVRRKLPSASEPATILMPNAPIVDLAVGERALWVISLGETFGGGADQPALYRVEPSGKFVSDTISLGADPVAVAAGEGAVWVAASGKVFRIDPQTRSVSNVIQMPLVSPSDIAVGEGAVWVANGGGTSVVRIDPKTNGVTSIPLGNRPAGIAAGDGAVWVTVY